MTNQQITDALDLMNNDQIIQFLNGTDTHLEEWNQTSSYSGSVSTLIDEFLSKSARDKGTILGGVSTGIIKPASHPQQSPNG